MATSDDPQASKESDDLQTMTIDGRTYTYVTNTFVQEAKLLIAALVEEGVPGKLRPGRTYIIRVPNFPETREKDAARQQRHQPSRHNPPTLTQVRHGAYATAT